MKKWYIERLYAENKELRELKPGESIFGRDENCDFPCPNDKITKFHCIILISKSTLRAFVEDVKSTNGTYADGVLIPSGIPCLLENGSVISLAVPETFLDINGQSSDFFFHLTSIDTNLNYINNPSSVFRNSIQEISEESEIIIKEELDATIDKQCQLMKKNVSADMQEPILITSDSEEETPHIDSNTDLHVKDKHIQPSLTLHQIIENVNDQLNNLNTGFREPQTCTGEFLPITTGAFQAVDQPSVKELEISQMTMHEVASSAQKQTHNKPKQSRRTTIATSLADNSDNSDDPTFEEYSSASASTSKKMKSTKPKRKGDSTQVKRSSNSKDLALEKCQPPKDRSNIEEKRDVHKKQSIPKKITSNQSKLEDLNFSTVKSSACAKPGQVDKRSSLALEPKNFYLRAKKKIVKKIASSISAPNAPGTSNLCESSPASLERDAGDVAQKSHLSRHSYGTRYAGHQQNYKTMIKYSENIIPKPLKIFDSQILSWSTKWIAEQNKFPQFPPILENNREAPQMYYTYKFFLEYKSTVEDLLLIDVWDAISTLQIDIKDKMKFVVKSITFDSVENHSKIKIQSAMPSTTVPVSVEDLVTIAFEIENPPNGDLGYIDTIKYQKESHKDGFLLTVEIIMRKRSILQGLHINDIVLIEPLLSLRCIFPLIRAVHALETSPLCNLVVSPKEEAYEILSTIPFQKTYNLNPEQLKAAEQCFTALKTKNATIQTIQGPPGTGKSHVICSIIMEHLLTSSDNLKQKVLVCAQSNNAVDDLVKKFLDMCEDKAFKDMQFNITRIGRPEIIQPCSNKISSLNQAMHNIYNIRNYPSSIQKELETIQLNIEIHKKSTASANDLRLKSLKKKFMQCVLQYFKSKNKNINSEDELIHTEEQNIIMKADVVFVTLAGINNSRMKILENQIHWCVINEAGKVSEPETLMPLLLGVDRLLLVGESLQVPEFFTSQRARNLGLAESMFSRLNSITSTWNQPPLVLFNQHRMHPEILHWPNTEFYGNKIKSILQKDDRFSSLPFYRVLPIVSTGIDTQSTSYQKFQIQMVAYLAISIKKVITSECNDFSFAVLTPYTAQCDAIKKAIKIVSPRSHSQIEVSNIDNFHGQERDVILVSLTKVPGTGCYVLPNRMSVLMTRARRSLILCGDPVPLSKDIMWNSLIEDARNRELEVKIDLNDLLVETDIEASILNILTV